MLSDSYPLLDVFWTMLWFFLFFAWIWLLIIVFGDIFRSRDMSGWSKALWTIFVVLVPLFGVLVDLIARGGRMHERAATEARQQDEAFALMSRRHRPPGQRRRGRQAGRIEGLRGDHGGRVPNGKGRDPPIRAQPYAKPPPTVRAAPESEAK